MLSDFLSPGFMPELTARIIVLVFAFAVHEFAHAWTANYFGDTTPAMNGRLTLNPLAHLDPIGSLMILFAGFGWAKPVPVNPYALSRRSPAALMWVSLAGPASNFLLAILAAVFFRVGLFNVNDIYFRSGWESFPSTVAWYFISINLLLMLFNLIPLAPLDGEKIFDYLLPPNLAGIFNSIRPYGPVILILLVFVVPRFFGINVIGLIIGPPMSLLMRLMLG